MTVKGVKMKKWTFMLLGVALLSCGVWLLGCSYGKMFLKQISKAIGPALPEKWARTYLQGKGVPEEDIVALVRKQDLGAARFQKFAECEDENVRHLVGEHPFVPIPILERLMGDSNQFVRAGVAENRNLPEEFALVLSKDKDLDVLRHLVSNPSVSSQIILDIRERTRRPWWRGGDNRSYPGLLDYAWNWNCPEPIRREILESGDKKAIEMLSQAQKWKHDAMPAQARSYLQGRGVLEEEITALESGQDLGEGRFQEFAESEDENVRCLVAKNPFVPIPILERLMGDSNRFVRAGVAQNRYLPEAFAVVLSKDKDLAVSAALVGNPSVPSSMILDIRERTRRPWWRGGDNRSYPGLWDYAWNWNCPEPIKREIMESGNKKAIEMLGWAQTWKQEEESGGKRARLFE